jgi:hypothetical protein
MESGVFRLYVKDNNLVTVDYTWYENRSYRSRRTVAFAEQKLITQMWLEADANKQWSKIEIERPLDKMVITRQGTEAVLRYRDKTTVFKLTPGELLYENYSPALFRWLVERYDHQKKGEQSIPMFFLSLSKPVTLEWKDQRTVLLARREIQLSRYVLLLLGIELIIWSDDSGKIYMVDVPIQYAHWMRDGYEAIRTQLMAKAGDDKVSQPTHKVLVQRAVKVPMRDKVSLATDIYRPQAEGKFPVILVRTPYRKEMDELSGYFYARRGYVFAVQDCRGRFGSEGEWEPFVNEPQDGYDTIEWLARQAWSNGKIGMIGGSYLGWVQWWAASKRPPHLVTIIPNVSPPEPFYNIPYEYGVFFILGAIWWADILESKATGSLDGVAMEKIADKRYSELLRSLPVVELDKKVLGKENPYWRKWIAHPTNDQYWERSNFYAKLKHTNIPVFHQSGWFDGDGIGSKLNYLKMKEYGHGHQKMVLGPWGHTAQAHRYAKGRDFGPNAVIDLDREYLRWFDRWLKGIDNGIEREPLVSLFVMGKNIWLKGNTYPLEGTRFDKWYLASGGKANTSKGDGQLLKELPKNPVTPVFPKDAAKITPKGTAILKGEHKQPQNLLRPTTAPVKAASHDTYVYDPADPTPDPRYFEAPKRQKEQVVSAEEVKKARENYHLDVTVKRSDILVYVTSPFEKPYTFAGPISAEIYASTSGRDTDWFVRLMEVDKHGKIFSLVQGMIRARFRHSTKKPELLVPNQIYKYKLDLWQTGITIPAGSRLRVEIASACFPFFSRNLNTGGHNEMDTKYIKATQKIYHGPNHPSHISIPAIPDDILPSLSKNNNMP